MGNTTPTLLEYTLGIDTDDPETYRVGFTMERYNNGALYLDLTDENGDLIADVTTNIPLMDEPYSNEAVLDTNNTPDIETFITENRFGENTGRTVRSGYCTYPVYRMNLDKIREHTFTDCTRN